MLRFAPVNSAWKAEGLALPQNEQVQHEQQENGITYVEQWPKPAVAGDVEEERHHESNIQQPPPLQEADAVFITNFLRAVDTGTPSGSTAPGPLRPLPSVLDVSRLGAAAPVLEGNRSAAMHGDSRLMQQHQTGGDPEVNSSPTNPEGQARAGNGHLQQRPPQEPALLGEVAKTAQQQQASMQW
jgi:hypothetical protein